MSERRICLLRGVNVGGVKVEMAPLRELAAGLGLQNPQTLLASGNLVVDSPLAPPALEARLEAAIAERFGRSIDVIVRTGEQWRVMMTANPFQEQAATDGAKLLVMVMKTGVRPGAVEALRAFAADGERVEEAGGDLFFWHPHGLGRSKMAEKAQPRLIGPGTGRNWNTALKLLALL